MLPMRASYATDPNPAFREILRDADHDEDNLTWLRRVATDLTTESTALLLMGGIDSLHFRLRVAQSHARHDLTPSNWSHVALLGKLGDGLERGTVYGIPLDAPRGYGFAPSSNAVVEESLATYVKPERFPNMAFVRVPVPWTKVVEQLKRFQQQRGVLDAVELVVQWLAFLWGVGRTGNPLVDGQGVPSAAMIEMVIGAAGFELTPGLASRSSCPEAIWQSARWWHEYYQRERPGQTSQETAPDATRLLTGAWRIERWFVNDSDEAQQTQGSRG